MYYEVRITVDATFIAEFEDADDAIEYAWEKVRDEGAYSIEIKEIKIGNKDE